jgi:hypothetical protein
MPTPAVTEPANNPTWIDASILVGSAIFIFALAISAYFEPQWRVLHFLQALIYVAVIVLTRRKSAWGFGAGVFIAVFWNTLVLFRSPVGSDAVQVIGSLVRTGQLERLDVLVQLFAAGGHFLIIVACLVGFSRIHPVARQWSQFAAGGALSIGYLLAMVFTIGPPEAAQHIKQAFGL